MFGFRKRRARDGADERQGLLARLRERLARTRGGLGGGLAALLRGRGVDEEVLEEIEARLLLADVGVTATTELVDALRRSRPRSGDEVVAVLRERMLEILAPCARPLEIPDEAHPFTILTVGVNGVGKTTTIGKLARRLRDEGLGVLLAAGDTFRAAAVEQLQAWGERNGVPVVAQGTGADAASVIHDAMTAAKARGIDVVVADTAGRLHTKHNLMEELRKIRRVMARLDPGAPHEVLLVLDATTGQNALAQARRFHDAVGVTGIALTKLDGTARGGIVLAIARELALPIRFIGIGEGAEDLRPFDAEAFVDAILDPGGEGEAVADG
ncbi:signal recognition particle-docking protein FtsY [Inmirania thermothiophila]|uniref:Signal recognition particle receptor FtsY n=1 Tax=Inmirania thermothiophila TaxID=1750597 RepID=A0A3N1Y603_9GAMM|nr:signal recognition particle-docking protein FtsY [Inmirania thermothiophila]ROR34239.1 signal recognition particle-docking protein FtsY [Inmirania thermothiophila]